MLGANDSLVIFELQSWRLDVAGVNGMSAEFDSELRWYRDNSSLDFRDVFLFLGGYRHGYL